MSPPVLLNPYRFGGGGGGQPTWVEEVQADAPILWYRQGESSGPTMEDSSGSNRDMTWVNVPGLGAAGALLDDATTSATYDGVNDYAEVVSGDAADVALRAIAGAFALECWIKPSSLTGSRGIFDRYGGGGATLSSYLFYVVSGVPRFILRNASDSDSTLIADAALGTVHWTHLLPTYDGTTMRIFINGILSASAASTFSSHNRATLMNVGRFVFGASFLAGGFQEALVYGSDLSARAAAHYLAGVRNSTGSLLAQRSSDVWTGGGRNLAAHSRGQVGDQQILAIATHAAITPSTPSGWTLLSRTTTTHSSLTIFTRTLTAPDLAANIVLSSGAQSGVEFRTYRYASAFTVRANGTGLVSPSFTVADRTIRFTAIARDNIGGGGSNGGTLTPDPALYDSAPMTWEWYQGVVAGEEPTPLGQTAPTRTATDTATSTTYPQWVDVEVT